MARLLVMRVRLQVFTKSLRSWYPKLYFRYGLAFGEGNPFMGLNFFIAIDLPKDQFSFMFFQV